MYLIGFMALATLDAKIYSRKYVKFTAVKISKLLKIHNTHGNIFWNILKDNGQPNPIAANVRLALKMI